MCGNQWFFFFLILLFPTPFFISQSITAQGSGNLFGLNIVWNVKTNMHILMIKLIPFYEDTTHLDIFTSECEEMDLGVCVLPIFKGKRREREDGLSVRKRNDAPDAPFDSISCSPPSLWRVCSGSSPSSCEARDVSSFEAVVDDMSGQAWGKTTERQERKEAKLGKLQSTFCRTSVKPEVSIATSSSSPVAPSTFSSVWQVLLLQRRGGKLPCKRGFSQVARLLWVQVWKRERVSLPEEGNLKGQKAMASIPRGCVCLLAGRVEDNLSSEPHPVVFGSGRQTSPRQRVGSSVPFSRHIRLTGRFLPKVIIPSSYLRWTLSEPGFLWPSSKCHLDMEEAHECSPVVLSPGICSSLIRIPAKRNWQGMNKGRR